MKRFILPVLIFLPILSVEAHTLAVKVEGQDVDNGGKIDSYNIEKNEFTFNGETIIQYQLMPNVMVTSTVTAEFEVSVSNNMTEVIMSNDGFPILPQFCWPSACLSIKPGETVSQKGELKSEIPTDIFFDSSSFSGYDGTFSIPCKITITQTNDAKNNFSFDINMIFDPEHNAGIEDFFTENQETTYYDLSGRKVTKPSKGIYLKTQGRKTTKVIL